jgi:hypothetical protein
LHKTHSSKYIYLLEDKHPPKVTSQEPVPSRQSHPEPELDMSKLHTPLYRLRLLPEDTQVPWLTGQWFHKIHTQSGKHFLENNLMPVFNVHLLYCLKAFYSEEESANAMDESHKLC